MMCSPFVAARLNEVVTEWGHRQARHRPARWRCDSCPARTAPHARPQRVTNPLGGRVGSEPESDPWTASDRAPRMSASASTRSLGGLCRPGFCSVPTDAVSARGCAGSTGCMTSRACVGSGGTAVVASHFAHFGEEDCLRGWNGSGTIFFSGCNLRCVFCQNHDISWEVCGERVSPQRLAQMMLELQDKGCHNINFVTPEHVVPQILEALPPAIDAGLRLPIVYNTSSYDSLDSLALMDGIVDIYMPDAKVWSRERARRFLRMPDYPEVLRATIPEMGRQVGEARL